MENDSRGTVEPVLFVRVSSNDQRQFPGCDFAVDERGVLLVRNGIKSGGLLIAAFAPGEWSSVTTAESPNDEGAVYITAPGQIGAKGGGRP